jgi:hypothetical protein
MLDCNRNFNAFQRRSMQLIGAMLGCSVALGVSFHSVERDHFSIATYYGIAALAAVPIIGTMIVIARYLAGEKDEYLRNLVVRAILWGLGMVMVADTFLGYIVEYRSLHLPYLTLNMDIFVVTAILSLRIQLWQNR